MNYEFVLGRFEREFGESELPDISANEILEFLSSITDGLRPATKRTRYTLLKSFFNFVRSTIHTDLANPCEASLVSKLFKSPKPTSWRILEKDMVDEIIFRTTKARNRLILELMARGGMRVSEVLGLRLRDIDDRKLVIAKPKSGKEQEVAFIPRKVANRLKEYANSKDLKPDDRIFLITYGVARKIVKKAGEIVGVPLRPHDLRRHAATYASRAGTPIEIVSKVILRHANLSTTQRYLGKVSDLEAIRWIENLYG